METRYSTLQKIHVTCKTCDLSESFYSNLSVERFKLNHEGHEIVGGEEQGTPSKAQAVKSTPAEATPLEEGTKLTKVMVDLVVFPALPNPVLRLRGFKDNLEDAFIITSSSQDNAKVREILAKGVYVDEGFSGLRYVWEPDAIEYGENARESLGLPVEVENGMRAAEFGPRPLQGPQDDDSSTVARTNEELFGSPRAGETNQTNEQLVAVTSSVPAAPNEKLERPAPISPLRSAEERQPEQEPMEASIPRPSGPKSAERKAAEATDDEFLLVSKSWYIQGGAMNRKEAVRISKILKAFRWKVEPMYTIGVILDDILSVETSKNQISRTLIKWIENAGYRLTAVTVDQGKPVAWFKKVLFDVPAVQASTEASGLKTRIDALTESVEEEQERAEE